MLKWVNRIRKMTRISYFFLSQSYSCCSAAYDLLLSKVLSFPFFSQISFLSPTKRLTTQNEMMRFCDFVILCEKKSKKQWNLVCFVLKCHKNFSILIFILFCLNFKLWNFPSTTQHDTFHVLNGKYKIVT